MLASPGISSSDDEVSECIPLVMLDSRVQMSFARPKKKTSSNGEKKHSNPPYSSVSCDNSQSDQSRQLRCVKCQKTKNPVNKLDIVL